MSSTQISATGDLLRKYRREAALTQDELGERASVSARSISDIERGISLSPHRGTLDALADALGLSAEEREQLQMSARTGRTTGEDATILSSPLASSTTEKENRSDWFGVRTPLRFMHAASHIRRAPSSIRLAVSLTVIVLIAGAAFIVKKEMLSPTAIAAARAFVPWQVVQHHPAGMGFAHGLAIGSSGDVYAATIGADSRSSGVWRLAPSGQVLAHWGRYRQATLYGNGIAVDPRGNVFIVDFPHDRALRISPAGRIIVAWGSHGTTPGKFIQAEAIAVDRAGHVFVSDATGRIQKFSETGKLLAVWSGCGSHPEDYCHPTDMTTDDQGNLYVSDIASESIRKISPAGRELQRWGTGGMTQLCGPNQMDFDPVGDLFVDDQVNGHIHKYSPTGHPITWWGDVTHGLSCPVGLGIDRQSDFYVSACNSAAIQKFSASGAQLKSWRPFWSTPVSFNGPSGMAIDRQGHILVVTSATASALREISRTGQSLLSWPDSVLGPGEAHAPAGASFDAAGNAYVLDSLTNQILELSATGKLIKSFGGEGSGPGQLENPSSVAVDRAGNIYVSDTGNSRVVKFSAGGRSIGQWDTAPHGTGLFLQPEGIALDTHGDVYVADQRKHAIEKLTSDGTLLAQWRGGSGGDALLDPAGIGVDGQGTVYVTDVGDSRVKALSPDGKIVAEWGRHGSQPGEFSQPGALAVDQSGNVYVADTGNNRIQKLAVQ